MASASLVLARSVPARSSGVSEGMSRSSCSRETIRCFNCQCQSFQSWSETSDQNPRPGELNCLRELSLADDGGSSLEPDAESFSMSRNYILGRAPVKEAARAKLYRAAL